VSRSGGSGLDGGWLAVVRRTMDQLRSGYWFIPLVCAVVASLLAIALVSVDRYLDDIGFAPKYTGGPENAMDTLTTIASSMITFTGLVFSITVVALQLTSSQLSPRALRNFLRDRESQLALGVFVATFVYAFIVLTRVRFEADDDPAFVPGLGVTGAMVLVAASVVLFVRLIHHTAQSLRAVHIIERIAAETHETIDRVYPPDGGVSDPPSHGDRLRTVPAGQAGVITDLDLDQLAEKAAEVGAVAELLHPIGAFVCRGAPLLTLHEQATGRSGAVPVDADPVDDDKRWHREIRMGSERTMRQDAAFGIRQLVDIADRALSPGVNDPTTAVQCLDRIHDVLRTLSGRPISTCWVGLAGDEPHAWAPAPSYEDYVRLGLDEIRDAGSGSALVHRRIESLLDDLLSIVDDDPQRRRVLLEQRLKLRSRRDGLPGVEAETVEVPNAASPV
jgi:uncharacterized membrane protein